MEQKGLWEDETADSLAIPKGAPLALRMAPFSLDEFLGQEDLLGEGRPLRLAIQGDTIPSMLLWGPPGSGKTALARLVAKKTRSCFSVLSAVSAGVSDVRKVVSSARLQGRKGIKTILFLDEIHRFNKTQQDALLPHVEDGTLTLIGATTENPFYSLNRALLSRLRVFSFKELAEKDISTLLERALGNKKRGLGADNVILDRRAQEHIVSFSKGDARVALNLLEALYNADKADAAPSMPVNLSYETVRKITQTPHLFYDKKGDQHYDTVSAYIKSMRGSDPDAAIYWLARMLEGGEDPRFIARRLMICAAEDVGNEDPTALLLAEAAFSAAMNLGMPEVRIPLAQVTIYVAQAPKSNAALKAIDQAMKDVREKPWYPVPLHLTGPGYVNPHEHPDVPQAYLPMEILGREYCRGKKQSQ